jgi:proteasome accessory factor C
VTASPTSSTSPTASPESPASPRVSGARDQVARLLRIVPYLHSHGAVRVDEAASELGIDQRQLVRDLRVLFMCGLPGGYPDDLIDVDIDALTDPDGDRVVRVSNADYLARPLRLTPTEATAVIVALRALRGATARGAVRDSIDSALAKLESATSTGPAIDPGVSEAEGDRLRLRATLAGAIASRRQLEIVYFVPSRDEESARIVDPADVVARRGADYLLAWCHTAGDIRSFRLDRIHQARVLETPIVHPTSTEDFAETFFETGEGIEVVTLRLQPPAHWIAHYYRPADVRQGADGVLEVDLTVADPRWLDRLLLKVTPYAVAVRPSGYGDRHLARVREAFSLYDRTA